MAEPFIKLYKKMLKWEWYDDPNTKVVFIHCLLRANWQETKWHGEVLKPGQFITSLASLSKETRLTVDQVRVALNHLKSTGEITSKSQARYRIITVVKWNDYQENPKLIPSESQANPKVVPTDKEYKNKKNNKNIYSAAEKSGGNTRKYSHEFFEELERRAELDPWGHEVGADDWED